jgi:UPF0755 protein
MKRLTLFILFCLLLAGGGFLWWQNSLTPVNSADETQQTFVINKGEGVHAIADQLQSLGLIKNATTFYLLVKQLGLQDKIQAGEFHLSPAMSAKEIAEALQVGTFDLQITIPEGKRAEEIADILQSKLPAYQESWRQKLIVHEGYLFPDTYSFTKDATIDEIIQTMTSNFNQKYMTLSASTRNLSKEDTVILASIVEREARYQEDRPLVASVLLNRLKIGMALQVDASVQYALGYQPTEKTWWKKDLSLDDLKFVSFYNTYLNTGLPPTPISNPGLEALQAVRTAPQTNYMYYISDKSGRNHYESTLEQQTADRQRYGI